MTQVDVKALARLARLEVSEDELAKLEKEIPSILAFVETIQAASAEASASDKSTAGQAGAPKKAELRNVMRADENPHESGTYTERLLSAAPTREGDRIAVKQVISRKKAEGGKQ